MTHKSGECSELTQNAARNETFRGIKLQQCCFNRPATICYYYHTPPHRHGLRNIYLQSLLLQFKSVVGGELRLPDLGKRTADTSSNEKMLIKRAHVLSCLWSTYLCITPILFVWWKLWEKAGSLKIKKRILHRRGERKRFVNMFWVFKKFVPMKCRLGKVKKDCWIL
jgi:hypothetical protein